jgi:hypothetical protein
MQDFFHAFTISTHVGNPHDKGLLSEPPEDGITLATYLGEGPPLASEPFS